MGGMKGLIKAAKIANGNDRSCATCPVKVYTGICNATSMEICRTQFVRGFEKGAKWYRTHLWRNACEIPKQSVPLLIHLSNGALVQGKFEEGYYSFSVPEGDNSFDKVGVVRFLYLKDLL